MTLLNEQEMISRLKCTRETFIGYIENGVFAPAIDRKRGRPTKNKAGSAVYDSETVEREVADFLAGKFTPHTVIGATFSSSEATSARAYRSGDNGDGSDSTGDEKQTGKVIHINGKIPGEKGAKEPDFDYKTVIGDISTFKLLKAKIVELSGRPDVPQSVKKDLRATFEMLRRDRIARKEAKRKIPIEKYEADCQKVHETWATVWSGEIGANAAKMIVRGIDRALGRKISIELSNIESIIHSEIVSASNKLVQPEILKILEKL